jgi:hypothetical protein
MINTQTTPLETIRQAIASVGHIPRELGELPDSPRRFPDGARCRVEIPSTESPTMLSALLDEAVRRATPIHRVSQGSGVTMLTQEELVELSRLGRAARIEVSLFARPNGSWHLSPSSRVPGGAYLAASAYGQEQVRQSVEEIKRAADAGIRSVLIADIGVLSLFGRLREAEVIPGDMQAKVSASFPVTNASTAALLEQLGANTLNLAPDLTLAQIASVRAAVSIPVDIYVEGPDLTGGIVRLHEIDEIVRVAAPVYVKFGLRNAPDIYPSGTHLERTGIELSRERVRRAQIGVEAIRRRFPDEPASLPGAPDLAIPVEP